MHIGPAWHESCGERLGDFVKQKECVPGLAAGGQHAVYFVDISSGIRGDEMAMSSRIASDDNRTVRRPVPFRNSGPELIKQTNMFIYVGFFSMQKPSLALIVWKWLRNDAACIFDRVENITAGPDVLRKISADVLNERTYPACLGLGYAQGPTYGTQLL
jgi:hypothetical protein